VSRRLVEVMGAFHVDGRDDSLVIRNRGGIHWKGGGVPPGTTIDLRHFGKGSIDFESSGAIRILR